jgi:hypothetical protein
MGLTTSLRCLLQPGSKVEVQEKGSWAEGQVFEKAQGTVSGAFRNSGGGI